MTNRLSYAIVVSYDGWGEVGRRLATWFLGLDECDGERSVQAHRCDSLNDALQGVELMRKGFNVGDEDPDERGYLEELRQRSADGDYVFTDEMNTAERLEDLDIWHLAYEY